ncbi:hypothetical protein K9M74_03945 [Candidatus Woesearchaeota archaeon]|nr:hypothetical protein [Candidatus Woesearchaeota archaeon]
MSEIINTRTGKYKTDNVNLEDTESTIAFKKAWYIYRFFKEINNEKRKKIITEMKKYVKINELKIKSPSKKKTNILVYCNELEGKKVLQKVFRKEISVMIPESEYQIKISRTNSFFKRKKELKKILLDKDREINFD